MISLVRKKHRVGRPSLMRSVVAYSLNPAVGLITGPIVASSLGAAGRGQLAAILQPLTLADSVAAAGVPTAVTFFIARGYLRRDTSKLAYQSVAVISLLVYAALLWYATKIVPAQNVSHLLVVVAWASVIAAAFANVRRAKHAAVQNWRVLDAERTVSALLRLISIASLAILGINSLEFFVAAYLTSGLIAFVLLAVPIPGNQTIGSKPVEKAVFLRFSGTAAVATIAVAAGNRLDQAILPIAISSTELGYYAVAVTVAEIPLIIGTVGARNMLSESASGLGKYSLIRIGLIIAMATGAIAVVLALLARPLVPLFFGDEFSESIDLIDVLLIGTLFSAITSVSASYITGKGRPSLASFVHLSNIAVVVSLYSLMWPDISAPSAAAIAVAAQATSCVVGVAMAVWLSLSSSTLTEPRLRSGK